MARSTPQQRVAVAKVYYSLLKQKLAGEKFSVEDDHFSRDWKFATIFTVVDVPKNFRGEVSWLENEWKCQGKWFERAGIFKAARAFHLISPCDIPYII